LEKLVVFGGGTDMFNFAESMAELLCGCNEFSEAIFFSNAKQQIEQLDNRFKVLPFGRLLDDELNSADLVFTTASTSSLEIVAREIPLGVACSVENQRTYYDSLFESKVAAQIGERTDSMGWNLDKEKILSLVTDADLRLDLKLQSRGYLDLKGAERIVEEILKL
jgi:spore coat polysaccharide biosynthesis predicted glycosyltransferase SpsG